MEARKTLTTPGGPIVASERTLRALFSIRREKILPEMFGKVAVSQMNFAALSDKIPPAAKPDWLEVLDDQPNAALPDRCLTATPLEAATIRMAIAVGASLVLLEGPIKERAKLSFIKSEGTVSLLVGAYRIGKLNAVEPMIKALTSMGFTDILPPPEGLQAIYRALSESH